MTSPVLENRDGARGFRAPQKAFEFTAFNTINTVVIYDKPDKGACAVPGERGLSGERDKGAGVLPAFEAVQAAAKHYEQLFSHADHNSALSRFNRLGGKPEDIDYELAELIEAALAYRTATDGLFDPTVKPSKGAEALSGERDQGAEALPEALSHQEPEGANLQIASLGGIAKGYIADALCELLKRHGVEHAIVNLGGNVKVFGGKPDGRGNTIPFTVGLRVPKKNVLREESFATVQLADGAVVTSGTYERGTRAPDGTWMHHIIDPRTGEPAETDLVSASVICDSALEADALATALIVMGLGRARKFIEQIPACEAVFVAADGSVVTTSNIGGKVPFALL